MSVDKVALCNMALANLRRERTITDIDLEDTAEAKTCRLFYDKALDATLEDADWTFAEATATLATHADDPPPDWTYRYGWPSNDCIAVRQLLVSGFDRFTTSLPFTIALNDAKTDRTILAMDESPTVRYTARVTDPQKWTQAFTTAFIWRLTMDLAMPLRGKTDMYRPALDQYRRALYDARRVNADTQNIGRPAKPKSLQSR